MTDIDINNLAYEYNRRIRLQFTLDSDAPEEYQEKWYDLLGTLSCEYPERRDLLNKWKTFMKLESNKKLPILDRAEGGLGGNENSTHKQIRTIGTNGGINSPSHGSTFKTLEMYVISSHEQRWGLSEVLDLKDSFKLLLEDELKGGDCTRALLTIE